MYIFAHPIRHSLSRVVVPATLHNVAGTTTLDRECPHFSLRRHCQNEWEPLKYILYMHSLYFAYLHFPRAKKTSIFPHLYQVIPKICSSEINQNIKNAH
jgi:hypothetical protein